MALQNPNSLYSEGNVVLDAQPYMRFAANSMMRRQAKSEALDKYLTELPKTINPAGMRNQDVGGFVEKTKAIQEYWLKNRDKIKDARVDNGTALSEYQYMIQDAKTYAQQSKSAVERLKPVLPILADPTKKELVKKPFLDALGMHELPLNDPRRKDLDLTTLDFNPKEFVADDWRKLDDTYAKRFTPTKIQTKTIPHPTDRYRQIDVTEKVFDPQMKSNFIATAIGDYHKIKGLAYSFDKTHPLGEFKEENAPLYNQLNAAYKNETGKDIEDNDELYAATQLMKLTTPIQTEKAVADWGAQNATRFAQQKELEGIRNRNIASRGGGSGAPANPNTMGLVIDAIGESQPLVSPKGVTIDKGIATDREGNYYTGKVILKEKDLPVGVVTVLKKGGIDVAKTKTFELDIREGKITYVKPEKGKIFNRTDVYNAQLADNSEPQKAKQKIYGTTTPNGKPPAPKQTSKKSKNDPMGIR